MICVSKNLGRCTQTSLHFLFSCLCGKHKLTAHCSQLTAQKLVLLFFCQKSKSAVVCRICIICVPSKFFTKLNFHINPAVKSKVPSWKIFISQLENYFFPVGKSKFRSRAILSDLLGLFLNYFKRFLFILTLMYTLWTKVKMFDSERCALRCPFCYGEFVIHCF